jgi:hypothetical protein
MDKIRLVNFSEMTGLMRIGEVRFGFFRLGLARFWFGFG